MIERWILWLIKWAGLSEKLLIINDLRLCSDELKPFIIEVEKEAKQQGWNGDTKRRIAVARYTREYGKKKDLGLMLELIVRNL